ncbi:hypothetical protein SSCG_03689 [Streptomyces clavuligerus]|nr:hypothetical protein SSCG_03689 [Streptomyces clavuligerus]
MPQDIAAFIPFPTRLGPGTGRAAAGHLRRPRFFGLLPRTHHPTAEDQAPPGWPESSSPCARSTCP